MTVMAAPVAGSRIMVVSPRCPARQPSGTAMENPARRGAVEARAVYQW